LFVYQKRFVLYLKLEVRFRMKLRALNPRNSYATFVRQPRSDELFVLVAGDYGVVEYSVVPNKPLEKKRELGNFFLFFLWSGLFVF
jgi:hypothetical protein